MNTNVLTVLQLFLNKLGQKNYIFLGTFSKYEETAAFHFFKNIGVIFQIILLFVCVAGAQSQKWEHSTNKPNQSGA